MTKRDGNIQNHITLRTCVFRPNYQSQNAFYRLQLIRKQVSDILLVNRHTLIAKQTTKHENYYPILGKYDLNIMTNKARQTIVRQKNDNNNKLTPYQPCFVRFLGITKTRDIGKKIHTIVALH